MKEIKIIQTKEQIANAIRNEILSGNILPDEELVQEKLAEMLGVSRMPVREALQSLEQEGMIERLSNRHMKVVSLKDNQIKEIFQMIASIEAQILWILILKKGTEKELCDFKNRLCTYVKPFMNGLPPEKELAFHQFVNEQANNPYIQQLFGKILDGYVAYTIMNLHDESNASEKYLNQLIEMLDLDYRDEQRMILERYYEELAEILIEHWRESVRRKKQYSV